MDIQQHNTSKGRKKQKPKQQIMKNVLLTPYKRSWPILVPEHQKEFDDHLHSNLSALVPQVQPKIPWSVLKGIPKEQRKEIRQKYRQPIDIDSNLRKSLIFGVNECTKALEQHKILAVLISSTCNPEIMVNHVIRMAEKRKIAVLVINSLKETLRKLVGFPCVCLGFRKHEKLENLGKLRQIVHFMYRIKNMKIDDILGMSDIVNLKLDPKEIKDIDNNNVIKESFLKANNLGRQKSVNKNSKKGLKKSDLDLEHSPNVSTVIISDSAMGIPMSEKNIPNTVQDLNKINESDIIMISDCSEYSFGDSVQFIDDSANKIFINNADPVLSNLERIVATDLPTTDQNSTNTRSDFIVAIVTHLSNDKAIETGPYLYRTSTKKRVFEPPQVQAPQNAAKTCSNSGTDDYIPFIDNSIEYVPSIIKRMKGNKKKKKKNI